MAVVDGCILLGVPAQHRWREYARSLCPESGSPNRQSHKQTLEAPQHDVRRPIVPGVSTGHGKGTTEAGFTRVGVLLLLLLLQISPAPCRCDVSLSLPLYPSHVTSLGGGYGGTRLPPRLG